MKQKKSRREVGGEESPIATSEECVSSLTSLVSFLSFCVLDIMVNLRTIFVDLLMDFARWSTVACVRNVVLSENKWLRLFWFLVFLGMIAAFIAQLVLIILKYLSYPAEIVTTMKFASQPFPDVTFCSYNPFKLSEVEKNPAFGEIKRMLDEYTAAEQGTGGGTNVFGFQGLSRFRRTLRGRDLLILLSANLTDAQKAPALYKVDEIVTECLFAGTTCAPGSIEAVPDPVYGRCFVYKGNNRTITRTGYAHGLRLILTANVADSFNFVSDYLPTTSRVGFRMTVNEENSFVAIDQAGFFVDVGFQTSVALAKARIERIVAPYGECVDSIPDALNHYSDLPYTLNACYTTCTQRKVVERCGCANPTYRKADNETWCVTPAEATCIASLRGSQRNTTHPNLNQHDDCGCKPPCEETHFIPTISALAYPAFSYTVGVGTTEQAEYLKHEQQSKTTTSTSTTSTTSTTTTTTTTTTETPSTSCSYSPEKQEMIAKVLSSGRFKVLNQEACEARPTFECDPAFSKEWWKCWPCYYECREIGKSVKTKLPNPALFPTPDVECRELFDDFAYIEMGSNPTFGPSWGGWDVGKSPSNTAECTAAIDKIAGGNVAGVPGRRKKRSGNITKEIALPGKGSCESWNTNFKSVEDCMKWYKTNGMIVNVFYETLEYQQLDESPTYSLSAAINDLGGQAGLWLGLSVVSVVECLGLLLMLVILCITGKRLVAGIDRGRREVPDYEDDDY